MQPFTFTTTLSLLAATFVLLSVDNLCKQFGPRSGLIVFNTRIVFLKDFLEKVNFDINSMNSVAQHNIGMKIYPACKDFKGSVGSCCLMIRLAPVLKTIFHQCVIPFSCS